MLSNIYDRLYFILEKLKGVEGRLDLLERSRRKRKGINVNTFYGEQVKGLKISRRQKKKALKNDNIHIWSKERFKNKKRSTNKELQLSEEA